MENYWVFSIFTDLMLFILGSILIKVFGFTGLLPYATLLIVLFTNSLLLPLIFQHLRKEEGINLKTDEVEELRMNVTENNVLIGGLVIVTNHRILYFRFGYLLKLDLKRANILRADFQYNSLFLRIPRVKIEYQNGSFAFFLSKQVDREYIRHLES